MDYEEILKFAFGIDLNKVDSTKKVVIKCYKDMIIEQIGEILKMEKRINHFRGKILEHITGLEKCGVVYKAKDKDVKLSEGYEKPASSKEVAGGFGLPSRDSKV